MMNTLTDWTLVTDEEPRLRVIGSTVPVWIYDGDVVQPALFEVSLEDPRITFWRTPDRAKLHKIVVFWMRRLTGQPSPRPPV